MPSPNDNIKQKAVKAFALFLEKKLIRQYKGEKLSLESNICLTMENLSVFLDDQMEANPDFSAEFLLECLFDAIDIKKFARLCENSYHDEILLPEDLIDLTITLHNEADEKVSYDEGRPENFYRDYYTHLLFSNSTEETIESDENTAMQDAELTSSFDFSGTR